MHCNYETKIQINRKNSNTTKELKQKSKQNKQTLKIMLIGNFGYYAPAGANEDPNAPWYGSDEDERPINVYPSRVTEILERDVELETRDDIDDIWLSDVFNESENHSIMELLSILKDYIERDLKENVTRRKGANLKEVLKETNSIKPSDFDVELIT